MGGFVVVVLCAYGRKMDGEMELNGNLGKRKELSVLHSLPPTCASLTPGSGSQCRRLVRNEKRKNCLICGEL